MINKSKMKVSVFILGLMLAVGQAFGADDKCVDGSVWGEFTTKVATDSDGDGFYEINTPSKLAWFACVTTHESATYGKAKIELTDDIDLEGKLFIPISESPAGGVKFAGTINGDGHTIRGLYIKGSEIIKPEYGGAPGYAQNVGFVSVLGGGTIENLVLEVSEIYASSSAGGTGSQGSSTNPVSVGTLVGWMSGGTIKNCVVEGQITSSGNKNRVGGLAGNVWGATITDCVSNVSISASGTDTHVGGIVGALRNGNEVNLSSCVFEGDTLISTGGNVGGIVGYYEKSNVKTQNALYYSGDYPGVGQGKTVETHKKDDLNTEDVICALNKGTWDDDAKTCSGATSDVWSEGQSAISMNGSDGYKITFDAKGGSFATGAKKSKVVAKGATITADEISIPTHADSAFAGWAVTSDATAPSPNLGEATQNTTIYAVWKPIFKVTFNAAPGEFPEGSVSTKELSVSQGDIVSVEGFKVPEIYEDTDDGNKKYYFTGWAFESKKFPENHEITSADTIHLANIVLDKDTTLYAVWTAAKTVTVTYNANEHGKTRVEFMRVEAGGVVPQPENPIAYEGYTFVKWCTETPCVNKFEFDEPISDNIILYADWASERYAINYELAGGTNNAANPPNYTIDTTDITLAAPTRNGYTFDGWFYSYSNNNGVEKFENQATQITSGTTGAITLYAKWIPNVYIVEYLSGNTISATVRYVEKKHDVDITLSDSLDVFSHIGCVQGGWSKVDYGNEEYKVDYGFKATYDENAKLILFPYWTCEEHGVTYVENGGLTNHGNPSSYRGPAALTLNNATWSQHDFAGWYKEANFKNKVGFIQDIDQDITLYAKWTRKIIYKPGAALSGTEAKDVTDNKQWNGTYTLRKSIDKYVRDNYILDGWSTSDGGAKEYVLGQKISGDITLTLYPHWTPEAFPIVYHNVEGATFETPNPETYTVEDGDIALNSPSKSGYNFLGWSLTENSTEYVDGIAAGSTGEANFYANWEKVYPFLVNDYGAIKVYEDENGKLTAELDGASSGSVNVITDEDNVVVDKVVLNRTFTVNETSSDQKYATIVLPFTIDQDKISGAEFFEFVDVDLEKNQVSFCNAFGDGHTQLVANTPYIVRATNANITFNLTEGETVKLNTSEMNNPVRGTTSKWEFRGTYSYKKWEEGDPELGSVYGYTAQARNNYAVGQFAKNGAGAFVRPFRANLFKVAGQQARRYSLTKSAAALNTASVDEETFPSSLDVVIVDRETEQTTVIGKLNTATGEIKIIENWFDMKGRKLNGKPTTKGIYYYNGKRVMVK